MKILFLALVSILFISCGKGGGLGGEKKNSWVAPTIYILRANNSENTTVLNNNDSLLMNDYFHFSNDKASDPKVSELNSNSGFSIQSQASCITGGKTFYTKESFNKHSVQIKEILPVDALLSRGETASSCKISITLINSAGSTKSYPLNEKKIEFSSFKEDLKVSKVLDESSLSKNVVPNAKVNDQVSLACQSFQNQITHSKSDPLTIDDVLPELNQKYKDISITQHQPHQLCRLTVRSNNSKSVSNQFEIHFKKLEPKLSYQLNPGRHGGRLIAYNIELSNPNVYPVSFAIKKSALNVSLTRTTYKPGGKESDGYDVNHNYNADLSISYTGNDKYFELENAFIIHLLPQESISLQGYRDVGNCKHNDCTRANVSSGSIPVYNLEQNFRDINEIKNSSAVVILDQIQPN